MNITFWVLMILMLLLAIGFLVYPILKVRQSSAIAYKDSNLTIHDEKIKELDLDLKEGRIDQGFYKAARDELDRELLIDVPMESKETAALHYAATAKRQPAIALIISIFIPLLALLLYLDLGMHAASDESFAASQKQQQQPGRQASVEDMLVKLEAKIEKEGGTLQEWIMLGRTHKHLGNNEQAANAFAVALEKDTNNVQLMLERAEVLALSNNQRFNDESRGLALKAYTLEPDSPNALWFIGVAEYQYGNYRQAIAHLLKLLPFTRGDDEVTKSVVGIVSKSRQALIAAGEEMPELAELLGVEAVPTKTATAGKALAAADKNSASEQLAGSATSLTVAVDISENVKHKFDVNDVVFVYAKAKQGPRMPLAVQRLTLGALPATVKLDDSMAMVEGMNLSAFEQLLVSARVTKTGSAIAQSGDYIGQISVEDKSIKTTLNIVIDTVVQ